MRVGVVVVDSRRVRGRSVRRIGRRAAETFRKRHMISRIEDGKAQTADSGGRVRAINVVCRGDFRAYNLNNRLFVGGNRLHFKFQSCESGVRLNAACGKKIDIYRAVRVRRVRNTAVRGRAACQRSAGQFEISGVIRDGDFSAINFAAADRHIDPDGIPLEIACRACRIGDGNAIGAYGRPLGVKLRIFRYRDRLLIRIGYAGAVRRRVPSGKLVIASYEGVLPQSLRFAVQKYLVRHGPFAAIGVKAHRVFFGRNGYGSVRNFKSDIVQVGIVNFSLLVSDRNDGIPNCGAFFYSKG